MKIRYVKRTCVSFMNLYEFVRLGGKLFYRKRYFKYFIHISVSCTFRTPIFFRKILQLACFVTLRMHSHCWSSSSVQSMLVKLIVISSVIVRLPASISMKRIYRNEEAGFNLMTNNNFQIPEEIVNLANERLTYIYKVHSALMCFLKRTVKHFTKRKLY